MTVEKTAIISMLRRIHLFRGMDDDTFNAAADLMEPVEIPSGMVIYKEGDQADFFYFILEGKVRILHSIARAGQVQQVSELIPDDYFGEEVLENEWPRQVSAETATDVILARLSVPHFIALLNLFPPLASRLQLILDSYHLQLKTRFDWLNPGETIYFVARRHVFFLLRGLLLPILVGMTVILISGSWFLSTQMISSLLTLVLSVIGTAGWLVWNYVDGVTITTSSPASALSSRSALSCSITAARKRPYQRCNRPLSIPPCGAAGSDMAMSLSVPILAPSFSAISPLLSKCKCLSRNGNYTGSIMPSILR
jgi:hypothetical protein